MPRASSSCHNPVHGTHRTAPARRGPPRPGPAYRRRRACWLSLAAVSAAGARAVSEVRPPRLDYTESTLPNGLRLILHEDHSTPIVNVQVWYHVGSKDERPGRTGFAHLLEHLMFKGSKNVEPEQHTALIAGVGGQADAYTTEDVTVFWETVPSAVPADGALARGGPHGDAAHRQAGRVRTGARGGEGRAADAHREPAVRAAARRS